MTVRRHVAMVSAGIAVPLTAFAGAVVWAYVHEEQVGVERMMLTHARALTAAVDLELTHAAASLIAVAAAAEVRAGEGAHFAEVAARVLPTQDSWLGLALGTPDGAPAGIARTLPPPGASPQRWPSSVSRHARVGDLEDRPGALPVFRIQVAYGGPEAPGRLFSATMDPGHFQRMIEAQGLPSGWIAGIVDRNGRFVARLPYVVPGSEPSAGFRKAIAGGEPERAFRTPVLEGTDAWQVYSRSNWSGWVAGIAAPARDVETPVWRAIAWTAGFGTLAFCVAFYFAARFGRRLGRSAEGLVEIARRLERGDDSPTAVAMPIREMDRVAGAMRRAADAIRANSRDLAEVRERLGTSTSLLQAISDNTADILIAVDTSGEILFANPPARVLLDAYWMGRFGAGSRFEPWAPGIFEETLGAGAHARIIRWERIPYRDEREVLRGMLGVGHDVTAERQLRAELQSMLESVEDGFFALDGHWRLLYVNAHAAASLQVDPADALGRDYWALFPAAAGTPLEQHYRAAAAGETRRFESSPDGDGKWFAHTCYPRRGGGISVFLRDVSAARRAAQAISRVEAELHAVFRALSDGVIVADMAGTPLYVNEAQARMLGFGDARDLAERLQEVEGLAGLLDLRMLDGAALPRALRPLQRVLRGESLRDVQLATRRIDTGQAWTLSYTGEPVYDADGTQVLALLVTRDVTEQKRAEAALHEWNASLERSVASRTRELREANHELEAFTYTVSHDLRAPLRAILGYATILEQEHAQGLDGEARKYLRSLALAGERLQRMIDDLLAYSRLSREQVAPVPVDLDEALESAVLNLDEIVKATGADLVVARPLGRALGHRAMLAQVLQNLLDNAMKFTRPGATPKVNVAASVRGGLLRLEVADQGIGIESHDVEAIFDVFQRLQAQGRYPGTGIGLAIVRRAVERMGGRAGIESEPGRGSRFWIELPAA